MSTWNKNQDDRLHKFEKLIHKQMELNKRTSRYYEERNEIFGYPTIILGAVATSSIFIGSDYEYMRYFNGGMTLIMTILTALKEWLKYEKKMNMHKNSESAYEEMVLDIDIQKDMEYNNRKNVGEYMKYIKDKYMSLKKATPNIPSKIEKKFDEGYDNFIEYLKTTGELSESSEIENLMNKGMKKEPIQDESGEHELKEIVIESNKGKSNISIDDGKFRMRNIEREIDTLTDNSFCNKM